MDGTLTQSGKFTPALLQALTDLTAADIKVIVTTGRSAGWVSGLAAYLSVDGALALLLSVSLEQKTSLSTQKVHRATYKLMQVA